MVIVFIFPGTKLRRGEKVLLIAELRRPERAAKRSPILILGKKGNLWVDFLMVIMASGIARGRVRTTTAAATESQNMAAILQKEVDRDIQPWLQWYDQLTPVKTGYPLTSILWPYRGLKFKVHRVHMFFEVDRWQIAGFFIESWAHVR